MWMDEGAPLDIFPMNHQGDILHSLIFLYCNRPEIYTIYSASVYLILTMSTDLNNVRMTLNISSNSGLTSSQR